MTLTTHAVVGAAVASLFPAHPVIGFIGGFASHFVLDSIPHWNEGKAILRHAGKSDEEKHVRIIRPSLGLLRDMLAVSIDSLLGFLLAFLILWGLFSVPLYIVFLGAFAGQLPDGLQFVYYIFKPKFMFKLQSFHAGIQTEFEDYRYLGIEAGLILAVVALGILGAFMLQ